MDFEQLLRKYLSGAITEPELEHFQALLDRVPEYKAELHQTLEIRSLLHDDALTLTAPLDLSEHIRIAVSSSFAADALVEQEEQARKRRIFLYPLRLSVGAIVAACLVVGVAFSPTLKNRSAADRGTSLAAAQAPAAVAAPAAAAPLTAPTLEAGSIASVQPAGRQADVRRNGAHPATSRTSTAQADRTDVSQKILASGMWMLGHEVPSRSGQAGNAELPPSSIAQYHIEDNGTEDNGSSSASAANTSHKDYARILSSDPAELLRHNFSRPSYNPSLDSGTHRAIEPARLNAKTGESMAMASTDGRRLTIGVTLGAGQVAENKSPTALLQNSYYLSFSLGGSDRIGVEMGASAFQQSGDSSASYGKPRVSSDGLLLSMSHSRLTDGGQYGLIGVNDNPYLAKKTLGNPSADEAPATTQTPPHSGTQTTDPPKAQARFEQQITYGAVFYDRRIRLSHTWDICGRVMFGGADNAVMGNIRAYAAFTPSEKNITLTMGVGGASLYNLNNTKGGPNGSVNYGIYYGIETGF